MYHPYRSLYQYWTDICPEDSSLLQVSWRIVNDSYRTDVCLLYPPSLIALACLQMACVLQKKEVSKQWFTELNVDIEKVGIFNLDLFIYINTNEQII